MDELLDFILKGITGKKVPFAKYENEGGKIIYEITPENSEIGILIGKEGKVVKSIQNILSVRAKLEKKFVILRIVNTKPN